MSINIEAIKMPAADLTLTELANYDTVRRLSKLADVPDAERAMLGQYLKKIKNGCVEVDYNVSRRIQAQKQTGIINQVYGRRYAQKGGLARFSKRTRATIANENYWDIDFSNSHLVILKQFLTKNDIAEAFSALIDYVENRDKHFQNLIDIGCTRDEAKQLYLRMTYLGSSMAHSQEINLDPVLLPPHVRQYELEIQQASNWVSTKEFAEQEVIGKLRSLNKAVSSAYKIKKSSYLSCVLNYIEDKCLAALHKHFEENGYSVDVLMFDGLMVRKSSNPINQDVLDAAEDAIEKATGYRMSLSIKPMAEPWDLTGEMVEELHSYANYNCEFNIELDCDLTEWNPAITHTFKYQQPRELYFMLKAYVEHFFARCDEPTTYLFIPRPHETNRPLYFSKEQLKDRLDELPLCTLRNNGFDMFLRWYIHDPFKRSFKKVDFAPFNKSYVPPENIYNLFNGFSCYCDAEYNVSQRQQLVKPFYDLVAVMTENNSACFTYAKNWLSHLIQYPHEKHGIAWVITGDQGTGKGTLIYALKCLLGEDLVNETGNVEQLFGNFAEGRFGKLLINANEVDLKGTAKYENTIKEAITDPTVDINPKGVRAYKVNDFANWIFTTNKPDPVPIDVKSGDRRFFITTSCNDYMTWTRKEWAELRAHFAKPEFISALYDDLMENDIDKVNWRDRPKTAATETLYEMNTPPEIGFFVDWFDSQERWEHENRDWFGEMFMERKMIYEMFRHYCSSSGYDNIAKNKRFWGQMRSLNLPMFENGINGRRGFRFTPQKCYDYLKLKYHHLYSHE